MDEPERNYLRQQIQQLERSKRRWKLATITLAAIVVVNVIMSGAVSLVFTKRYEVMLRQAILNAELAEMARRQADEAEQKLRQKGEERSRSR
jgi:hypothetical protein